jgi:hypothetical protein
MLGSLTCSYEGERQRDASAKSDYTAPHFVGFFLLFYTAAAPDCLSLPVREVLG